jgi:hypothetical protein
VHGRDRGVGGAGQGVDATLATVVAVLDGRLPVAGGTLVTAGILLRA